MRNKETYRFTWNHNETRGDMRVPVGSCGTMWNNVGTRIRVEPQEVPWNRED